MKSEAAQAAKAIKAELKSAFPSVKFSVRSEYFAGGSAVHIEYEDGPLTQTVQNLVDKYQFVTFNSQEDLYEHNNVNEEIPQAKYIQVSRNISEKTRLEIAEELGIAKEEINGYNPQLREYNSCLIRREFQQRTYGVEPVSEVVYEDELPIFQETARAEAEAQEVAPAPVESPELYIRAALGCISQNAVFEQDIQVCKQYLLRALELIGQAKEAAPEPSQEETYIVMQNSNSTGVIGTLQASSKKAALNKIADRLKQQKFEEVSIEKGFVFFKAYWKKGQSETEATLFSSKEECTTFFKEYVWGCCFLTVDESKNWKF